MKNKLQSNLIGRFITLTDDTSNKSYCIVAVWLPDADRTPSIALESVNAFGRSIGGPIIISYLDAITFQ